MILHIGGGRTVKKKDIIGIFDMDNVTVTAAGRAFLVGAAKAGRLVPGETDIPRSFLLCDAEEGGRFSIRARARARVRGERPKDALYLSHISPASLAARTEDFFQGEE